MEQSQQGRDAWRYPNAWKDHLVRTFPGIVKRTQPSQMRAHAQIHSAQRDENGRFNNLDGHGIPEWSEAFARDLQRGVEAMQREWGTLPSTHGGLLRSRVELIDPFAIEAAIAQLEQDNPELHAILRYFQTPPPLRRYESVEDFALSLGETYDRRGVYRRLRWACYGVWERLPLAERLKADGEA